MTFLLKLILLNLLLLNLLLPQGLETQIRTQEDALAIAQVPSLSRALALSLSTALAVSLSHSLSFFRFRSLALSRALALSRSLARSRSRSLSLAAIVSPPVRFFAAGRQRSEQNVIGWAQRVNRMHEESTPKLES